MAELPTLVYTTLGVGYGPYEVVEFKLIDLSPHKRPALFVSL